MDFYYDINNDLEAGCDEAGRGCLAGPVVAATVIFNKDYRNLQINDSKKLNELKRNELRQLIEKEAVAWAVAFVDHQEIDKINILNASFLAMHRAIKKLDVIPELLLIDGNRFKPYAHIKHECIIKGDGKYLSIAAASILAKTYRDDIMIEAAKKYPNYAWEKNKAYATKAHRLALQKYGQTPLHRKSFTVKRQLKFDF